MDARIDAEHKFTAQAHCVCAVNTNKKLHFPLPSLQQSGYLICQKKRFHYRYAAGCYAFQAEFQHMLEADMVTDKLTKLHNGQSHKMYLIFFKCAKRHT